MTQAEQNPFPNSDTNKRYYTYDYALKKRFGGKIAKLSLDAGFSCPNLDGTCGVGGCIYCSGRGSGDFAPSCTLSIAEQIRVQKTLVQKKWKPVGYIAYFQAHTNTYAPIEVLRKVFEEALEQEDIVGLNIATRADCLPDDVVDLLAELAERTVLTVELGLQSSDDRTAKAIHRGHDFAQFEAGVLKLRRSSSKIRLCFHIILGLPGEGEPEMLQTAEDVARLHPEQVKIHLLHVLKGTEMGRIFERGEYVPLTEEEYLGLVAKVLVRLPEDIVIGRLTGDGKQSDLLAPMWSVKKTAVVNDLDKLMFRMDLWQGKEVALLGPDGTNAR